MQRRYSFKLDESKSVQNKIGPSAQKQRICYQSHACLLKVENLKFKEGLSFKIIIFSVYVT